MVNSSCFAALFAATRPFTQLMSWPDTVATWAAAILGLLPRRKELAPGAHGRSIDGSSQHHGA